MDWITDRLPTEADADSDGDVAVKQRPASDDRIFLHWAFVKPGTAWRRTGYWNAPESDAPITEPTPTPTPQPRRIVSITESEGTVMAVADDGTAWRLSTDRSLWFQLPALPDKE